MVFALALLSNLLLATAALAAPSRLGARLERRRAGRQSQPIRLLESNHLDNLASNASHVEYSSNWAGAVWDSYPSGTFTSVTGTFTVPTPSGSSGAASAWVGIDGDTCGTAILQTGIDFTISGGQVSYDAWYEWYPDYAYDFSGITIKAGDSIKLTVTASSTKAGTAVIQNLTTGKTVTKSLTSSAALCEENAEWIVEDFEEGSSLVPFADFGTVTFTNAVATTKSGTTVGPSGSTLIDIEQNNKVLTSVSTTSSGVTISYV
ncbi:peptidase A4 family-domain-containing protein [Gymnopilus junonius]|uniref:Peptidase A4 family-domain-containing protein n=1 Tax=Gymnopilus junonius TaxID=109634 RepID=A0A9P5NJ44_GYMJU|nr:peptidase A4 family-domain-containing protein [Gymnopilus junonius]